MPLGQTAISCLDFPLPRDPLAYRAIVDELAALSPLRDVSALATELLPCAYWPVPATRQPALTRAASAPPIAVAQATGDGQTPYEWGVALAGQLDAGVLLAGTAYGHTVAQLSRCVSSQVDDYLVHLRRPAVGASCPGDPQPRLWLPPPGLPRDTPLPSG